MKNNTTEIVFILDRSGSMAGLEKDTIGGYNGLLSKQQKEQGDAWVTTVLFDDRYDIIHDRKDIHDVSKLTDNEYYPRGMTGLLDAIGKSILRIKRKQERMNKEDVPENTLVVITTDGRENASKEFTYKDIHTLIKKQQEIYGWEFLFLGANIDSEREGRKLGLRKERTVNYHADRKGVTKHYDELSKTVSHFRQSSKIDDSWSELLPPLKLRFEVGASRVS